jgi:hypothetical protein
MTYVPWLREHHGAWDCSTSVIDCVKVTLVCVIRVPSQVGNSHWGDFWVLTIEILVFASPTGYMLTFFGFSLLNWIIFLNSFKKIRNFPAILIFNWLFLQLNHFKTLKDTSFASSL